MALEVGDVIRQKSGQPFRSGCGADPEAVVISVKPLAWVSEGGDMLWRTNLDPDSVEVIRKATPEELKAANRRLVDVKRGECERQIRKLIEVMTTDSLPEVAYDVLLDMLSEKQAERLSELVDATDGDFYIKERRVEWCRTEHNRVPWGYVLGDEDVPLPLASKDELAAGLTSNMFGERDTIPAGFEYAESILRAEGVNDIVIHTALRVLCNSIAKQIRALQ